MPTLRILERNRKKKGGKTQSRGDKMKELRRVKEKKKSQMIHILIILCRILFLNFKTPLELVGATTLNLISKSLRLRKDPMVCWMKELSPSTPLYTFVQVPRFHSFRNFCSTHFALFVAFEIPRHGFEPTTSWLWILPWTTRPSELDKCIFLRVN